MGIKAKFIDQVIMGSLVATAPVWLVCGNKGLALFLGALWGSANLFVLKQLVKELLTKEKKDYLKIALFASLKCPLLYGAGYALLKIPALNPHYLLTGFSLIFVMMVLLGFKVTLLKRAP